jgi:hypothetical protein
MSTKTKLALILALALAVSGAALTLATQTRGAASGAPARPEGPCDIYAAAGTPCAAAHSTTRALYASYNGPLYQVLRQSDGKTLDIGVVQPSASPVPDAGGCRRAGPVLRQYLLLDHDDLRSIRQRQPPDPGASGRIQRPRHGRVQ